VAPPVPGLEPDEHLLDKMTVTFRGSLAASMRGLALASQRARLKTFRVWAAGAEANGFPVGKPEMTLGVTERRVLVWLPTFWLGRPKVLAGSLAYDRIAQVEVYRAGLAVSLTFGMTTGEYVEVESMRARHMRRIRDIVREHMGPR
jgi:hypothetical protein